MVTNQINGEYDNILNNLKQEFLEKWNNIRPIKTVKTINNFERYQTLGAGSFGRVVLAKEKSTQKFYAIKIMSKTTIIKFKQIQHTLNEKRVLMSISFPFAIFMEYSFKDNSYIYFVLPFIGGGEMFTHLRRRKKFDEPLAKFYAAQVLLTIEYLHHLDLVYRDLKPENILIDCEGYIKVTDFGFCKMVEGRTWTLCGTPDYIAPEIILCKGYGKSADWWSFGVLIFEMSAGYAPFYSRNTVKIYENIVEGKFKLARHFSADLQDLLGNVLQTDLSRRLGNLKNGVNDIKTHKWFTEINWLHIYHRKVEPPFQPTCKDGTDATYFNYYKEEPLIESFVDYYEKEFENF